MDMGFNQYSDEQLVDIIYRTNFEFYELVYQHDWLKNVFKVIDQKIITSQQIDFMVQAFGGPKNYCGRSPDEAHPHIFVDEEMWEMRELLLRQAFIKVNEPADIKERWLKIDNAFKSRIVMKSPEECKKRYNTDEIIIVPNPNKNRAA